MFVGCLLLAALSQLVIGGSRPVSDASITRYLPFKSKDLYWKGEPPREDYNYLHVEVRPGQPKRFTINRFRPQSAEPYAAVEVFK